jgi:hypothetical protein
MGRGQFFKFFRCSNDFYYAKRGFLTVNASLRSLNYVSGVYIVQVSLLLMGPLVRPSSVKKLQNFFNLSHETVSLR